MPAKAPPARLAVCYATRAAGAFKGHAKLCPDQELIEAIRLDRGGISPAYARL
jgi:hypothetical protein